MNSQYVNNRHANKQLVNIENWSHTKVLPNIFYDAKLYNWPINYLVLSFLLLHSLFLDIAYNKIIYTQVNIYLHLCV